MDKATLTERYKHRPEIYIDHRISLINPSTMDNMTRLTFWGDGIAREIADMQGSIELLKTYQQLLYDRAQEIVSAPWHQELCLKRERNYATDRIIYSLYLLKVYDVDGITPETMEKTIYPGPERHKAIAAFRAAQKKRPGIIAKMEIEKNHW